MVTLKTVTRSKDSNDDFGGDITIPPNQWDASKELSSFLDVLFADKLLSLYNHKQITKEFPQPDGVSIYSSSWQLFSYLLLSERSW